MLRDKGVTYIMKRRREALASSLISMMVVTVVAVSTAVAADQKLANTWYTDPKGYFRIVPPAGWQTQEYPDDPRGKVAFLGPGGVDLRVLVNAVNFDSTDELVDFCRGVEKQIGTDTHIKKIVFDGRPAVQRSFEFRGLRLYYIDFLLGKVDHNLAYSASASQYDTYLSVAKTSMDTYSPIAVSVSGEEATKHAVAKCYRLAQLMLELGNKQLALQCVQDGLKLDPSNADLIALNEQIQGKPEGASAPEPEPRSPVVEGEQHKPDAKADIPAAPPDEAEAPPEGEAAEESNGSAGDVLFGLFALFMVYLFFRRIGRFWNRMQQ